MSGSSNPGFSIDPDAVRALAGNLGGILMQAISAARDLERLVVPPAAYAPIGTAVAAGASALQDGQLAAVRSAMRVLSDISSEVAAVSVRAEAADAAVAGELDRLHGGSGSYSSSSGSSLWGSVTAFSLASTAMAGGSHPTAGGSVDAVLDYLGRNGMGQLPHQPVRPGQFDTPRTLVDWLDTDPDNQTRLGVIGVYAGNSGNLADVPGGVHPGDVVYVDRWQLSGPDTAPASLACLGVVGNDGRLYNQGAIGTAGWTGVTDLRVYRPIDGADIV